MIDLGPANARLCSLIRSAADADLGRPTPCTEYTVGDLLDHIAGVTIAFGGAAAKASGAAANMGPAGDAANLPPDWRSSIPQRLTGLVDAWRTPEAWNGMTRVGGQDQPAEVAGIITLGELVVHGWDLARATRQPYEQDQASLVPLYDLVVKTFGSGNAPPGAGVRTCRSRAQRRPNDGPDPGPVWGAIQPGNRTLNRRIKSLSGASPIKGAERLIAGYWAVDREKGQTHGSADLEGRRRRRRGDAGRVGEDQGPT
jgi:uncharacterized protein (TIGR03086 family)